MLTAACKSGPAAWIILATMALVGMGLVASGEEAEQVASSGKEVFLAQKCNLCHSIEALGIEKRSKSESAATQGSDLSTIGDQHTAEWIASYLKKEETLNDKEHKKSFRGEAADLQALVEWLGKMKAPTEGSAAADEG